jgi:hypothetical protein
MKSNKSNKSNIGDNIFTNGKIINDSFINGFNPSFNNKNRTKRIGIDEVVWESYSNVEGYDLVRYFINENGVFPNNTIYTSDSKKGSISFDYLFDMIKSLPNVDILFQSYDKSIDKIRKCFVKYESHKSPTNFKELRDCEKNLKIITIANSVSILHPETNISSDIDDMINSARIEKNKNKTTVGLISRDNGGFFINEVKFDSKISTELNLHYGENFEDFHKTFVKKLATTNKGISLLHGNPGTGKTSYIRYLIKELNDTTDKKVVIVPSNLISSLLDPDFNTFLVDTIDMYGNLDEDDLNNDLISNDDDLIDEYEHDKIPCTGIILILEDSESILMRRDNSHDSQSTSNILNLTDGILNDIFGIQIIATYNTKDENIDGAILRTKRLIAKKEFKKLSLVDAKKLANYLNIDDNKIQKAMSVSDIYSLLDEDMENILVEKATKKELGFKI